MPILTKQDAFAVYLQVRNADGTPYTIATAPTVVICKDNGSFATATNTPIHKGSGVWRLALTGSAAGETDADYVIVSWSGSGILTDTLVIVTEGDYTRERAAKLDNADVRVGSRSSHTAAQAATSVWAYSFDGNTTQGDTLISMSGLLSQIMRYGRLASATVFGSTNTTLTLTGMPTVPDNSYVGCIAVVSNNANLVRQARRITGYANNTKVLSVAPAWDANPAIGHTLDILSVFLGDPAEIAAIRARTDNLPAAPASSGDVSAVYGVVTGLPTSTSIANAVWGATTKVVGLSVNNEALMSRLLGFTNATGFTAASLALAPVGSGSGGSGIPAPEAGLVRLVRGPLRLAVDGWAGAVEACVGDTVPLLIQITDATGAILPLGGAVVTAKVRAASGEVLAAGIIPDEISALSASALIILPPAATIVSGAHTLTITRAAGVKDRQSVQIPLVIREA